jgi:hypothetical protein
MSLAGLGNHNALTQTVSVDFLTEATCVSLTEVEALICIHYLSKKKTYEELE